MMHASFSVFLNFKQEEKGFKWKILRKDDLLNAAISINGIFHAMLSRE